ncbi:copper radical oxidase [Cyathus striatus]|nr:copper radical oxidase [Cyathus striatus]
MSLLNLITASTLLLSTHVRPSFAAQAGSFADGGNTQVSAMMMFVGNSEKVYILDKAENNPAVVNGHPAWGSVWDINTHQSTVMDVRTNTFCSSGMHLPNGSYITLGGNGAVGPGGNIGSQTNPGGGSGAWDSTFQDFDGAKSIRVLNPCTSSDDMSSTKCTWYDDPSVLAMQKKRWYSAAEATGTGEVVILGGFVNGGYVNRNTDNTDPEFEGGAAECTYEFYPPRDGTPQAVQFLIQTSGLNSYAHTFMMASGKMFVQANVSTMLWDYENNIETPLPPMPNNVARVYPASGAVAMLPLTPSNNYTQTILFCGGNAMNEEGYGNYTCPLYNTWEYPASNDCQRITPEPADGSAQRRTMGQFIILPDGKLLVVNGGLNGTAGYAQATGQTATFAEMPFGESLASGPVGTPAIYDPSAPQGSRWSNAGFATSNIARLYHSSAILLPDASVLIAGSNPNVDVNTSTVYPTTYQAEIFYPPYFNASTRPSPSGSSLNNTYTVNSDGSIVLHVSQAPPNANLFQPAGGVPSNGTYVIVGNGAIGQQPTAAVGALPDSVRSDNVQGSGNGSNSQSSSSGGSGGSASSASLGTKPSLVLAAAAVVALLFV